MQKINLIWIQHAVCFFISVGCMSCSRSQYQLRAEVEINAVYDAIKNFFEERGYYPVATNRVCVMEIKEVLPVLLALPESAMARHLNPGGCVYININPDRYLNGNYLDPWMLPYHLILNTDCMRRISIGDVEINDNVAVWSDGPNRKNELGQGDDICSWKISKEAQTCYGTNQNIRTRSR